MQDSIRTSALIKAAGILLGECLFGVNGPFLFSHLGWFDRNVPAAAFVPGAAFTGVLLGAGVGYAVAAGLLHLRRREQAAGDAAHRITFDSHLGANLRA
jgi:hypothetical protein